MARADGRLFVETALAPGVRPRVSRLLPGSLAEEEAEEAPSARRRLPRDGRVAAGARRHPAHRHGSPGLRRASRDGGRDGARRSIGSPGTPIPCPRPRTTRSSTSGRDARSGASCCAGGLARPLPARPARSAAGIARSSRCPDSSATATTSQSAYLPGRLEHRVALGEDEQRHRRDLREHLRLAPSRRGDDDPAPRGDRPQARHRELAPDDDDHHPRRREAELHERDERRRDQQLVGDRIEQRPERRDLARAAARASRRGSRSRPPSGRSAAPPSPARRTSSAARRRETGRERCAAASARSEG